MVDIRDLSIQNRFLRYLIAMWILVLPFAWLYAHVDPGLSDLRLNAAIVIAVTLTAYYIYREFTVPERFNNGEKITVFYLSGYVECPNCKGRIPLRFPHLIRRGTGFRLDSCLILYFLAKPAVRQHLKVCTGNPSDLPEADLLEGLEDAEGE